MKKEQVLAKLRSCGLVAVVRAKDADDAMRIAEACIEGGCAGIELTYTTPGVNAIIEKMAREYDGTDFVIGAGTVMVPWAVIDLFTGNLGGAIRLMVIWGLIALFRRVGEPKFVGDQTGLSPILSLVSIYVGMRLGGVLGMIFGPTVLLIALNLVKLGLFDGVRADAEAAVEDVIAILRERPESE